VKPTAEQLSPDFRVVLLRAPVPLDLARCRVLLELGQGSSASSAAPPSEPSQGNMADTVMRTRCPVCGQGHMVIVGKVEPMRLGRAEAEVIGVEAADTS
jgi:hypothetical protein